MKTLLSALLPISMVALLAACNPGATVVTDSGSVIHASGKKITLRAPGHPNASISADGELEIGDKPVKVDAAQRVLLQSYQKEMAAMTNDGIAIGMQGAALAGKAVSGALKGVIKGDSDERNASVEAEAKKIEAQALQLCRRLVTIKASQDALAASLPQFEPYATLDQSDVDDCERDQENTYSAGKDVGGSLGKAIKGAGGEEGTDAADRADQASSTAEAKEQTTVDGAEKH